MKATKKIALNALAMALVIISTVFLHLELGTSFVNLGDVFIFFFAIYYGPFCGALAGGVGSFIADAIVHPSTMFYTLIIKAIEGLVVGLIAHKFHKDSLSIGKKNLIYFISMFVGSIAMIGGYFLAKAFFYGNVETALVSLVSNLVQALVSLVIAMVLCNIFEKTGIGKKV